MFQHVEQVATLDVNTLTQSVRLGFWPEKRDARQAAGDPDSTLSTVATMRGTVLFISHDATRTGAPIALLNLLDCFSRNGLQFEVLLRGGGDLIDRFRSTARVTCWPGSTNDPAAGGLATARDAVRTLWPGRRQATQRHAPRTAELVEEFRSRGVSLVYSNTITNGEVLSALKPLDVPVISHVHELDYWMTHRVPRTALELARACTDTFIAASDAVARSLESVLGVPRSRIVTIHESIGLVDVPAAARSRERARWGIPANDFVVGASGTMDWRKGVDLVGPLAREVERQSPGSPVHWVWVGGEKEGPEAGKLRHDFHRMGLESRLHLTGVVETPREAFAACDAFLVLSREDPFPLVMLEAASVGLPILCFDGAGGSPEFVRQDAGFVVPYLDLHGMASRVLELRRSPDHRHALGRTARTRVETDHNVTGAASAILDLMERATAGSRA